MKKQKTVKFRTALKYCAMVLAVYTAAVMLIFLLMGDQLKYRNSRTNIEMPEATTGSVELAEGSTVEQVFYTEIQRIFKINVLWGTYYRPNSGTVSVELLRGDTGEILVSQSFEAANIPEGGSTEIALEKPIEGLYQVPLRLKITSDSPAGAAVTPLINNAAEPEIYEGFSLFLNGEPTPGILCFSVTGEDYIWFGIHCVEFAAAGGLVIAAAMAVILAKIKQGKTSYIVNAVIALKKYKFLIQQLVSRDFKSKYKRSFFGVLWSFLNPLLTSMVMYFVFSNLFRFSIDYYTVYLISGTVMFNFFSECVGMCLMSITGNSALIIKVYVPKYVYPLTRTLSSGINLALALIPVIIIAFINGIAPTPAWILIIFPLIFFMIFCYGFGMLLASLMVFFRDMQFLWGVISMIWMYLTPIFYPVDILPDNMIPILNSNPVYYYVTFLRTCIMEGVSPEPFVYFMCVIFAVGALAVGGTVFKKTQDKFVLYL